MHRCLNWTFRVLRGTSQGGPWPSHPRDLEYREHPVGQHCGSIWYCHRCGTIYGKRNEKCAEHIAVQKQGGTVGPGVKTPNKSVGSGGSVCCYGGFSRISWALVSKPVPFCGFISSPSGVYNIITQITLMWKYNCHGEVGIRLDDHEGWEYSRYCGSDKLHPKRTRLFGLPAWRQNGHSDPERDGLQAPPSRYCVIWNGHYGWDPDSHHPVLCSGVTDMYHIIHHH